MLVSSLVQYDFEELTQIMQQIQWLKNGDVYSGDSMIHLLLKLNYDSCGSIYVQSKLNEQKIIALLDLFIQNGQDINAVNGQGEQPLMMFTRIKSVV
jgi:hypothetical protein